MAQVEHHDVATGPIYHAGAAPGPGLYRCVQVPESVVHIDDDSATLPKCEQVGDAATTYRRVVDERTAIDGANGIVPVNTTKSK